MTPQPYTYRHGARIPVTCPRCGDWMCMGTHQDSNNVRRHMPICPPCGITTPTRTDMDEALAEARRMAYGRISGRVGRIERILGWWWGEMWRCV